MNTVVAINGRDLTEDEIFKVIEDRARSLGRVPNLPVDVSLRLKPADLAVVFDAGFLNAQRIRAWRGFPFDDEVWSEILRVVSLQKHEWNSRSTREQEIKRREREVRKAQFRAERKVRRAAHEHHVEQIRSQVVSTVVGFVYVLSNPSYPDLLKIGCTTRSVEERMGELSRSTGVPTPFRIECFFESSNPKSDEEHLHERLGSYRVSDAREFFRIGLQEAVESITNALGRCPKFPQSS